MADQQLFPSYLASKRTAVDAYLAGHMPAALTEGDAQGDLDRYLYEPHRRFVCGEGKRIRPALALRGAEAVGQTQECALAAAAAIETFQGAALIHDDIADEGELRRGEPCLHLTEGMGVAINVGDLALVDVFELVLTAAALPEERKLRVLRDLVVMERHTLEGQALDLGWVRDGRWDLAPDDYLYMARSKTAYYSAAFPLAVGAACAGATSEQEHGLFEVGLHAGLAFQLQDDLLNLVGNAEAQGKDFRSDITEGKRTYMVVTALRDLGEEDRAELAGLLGGHVTDRAQLDRAVELIERGGGIAAARKVMDEHVERAKGQANELAERALITNVSRDVLVSMADFFVRRSF